MPSPGSTVCFQRGLTAASGNLRAVSGRQPGARIRAFASSSAARRRCSYHQQHVAPQIQLPTQKRTFSTSLPSRRAAVKEDFDPKSVDRESDEVDVCIVGGGMYIFVNYFYSLMQLLTPLIQVLLDSAQQFD